MRGRILVLVVALLALAAPSRAAACRTIAVAGSIQAALAQSQPCDWIVIPPGTYRESLVVTTPSVHLRGLNRNAVVLDGRHGQGTTGIEIRAPGVSVENMTVRNFDGRDRTGGRQVWWNGGGTPGGIRAWRGRYLTTYDTGLTGVAGVAATSAVGGSLDHVYAAGFADAGIAVAGCRDCQVTVAHAFAERNAVGLSATNAGGRLVVQDSVFARNAVGLAATSSATAGSPGAQLGTCGAGTPASLPASIASTGISRCTVFRRNRVESNDNLTVPFDTAAPPLPWGSGIVLSGTYGDSVANNIVTGNQNLGILLRERADPSPTASGADFFQSTGNRVSRNIVRGGRWDVALEGGLFGAMQSVGNCVSGNLIRRSLPADLRPWSCMLRTTPNPDATSSNAVLRFVTKLETAGAHRPRAQPPPPAQPTMPKPCAGIPPTPLCSSG
jgi:parallel beta-helix repeat protein